MIFTNSRNKKYKALQSTFVKNSAWGIASNILQILFVCGFFSIVARKFNSSDFARFLISNTVYQIIAAFSSMGLGQWFIRQYVIDEEKLTLTSKFMKTQIGLGILFYLVNIVLAYLIYPDPQIRVLCIILGTNIIFDNFINAIKTLNIAENEQQKSAKILVVDGFLKLVVGCLLFIHPFSTVMLSVGMIAVRMMTLSLFIKLGSANSLSLGSLWRASISYNDLKVLIIKNWQFIVIGSISIIYWKIGNIIISKMLPLSNVADYEISFRIFSVLQILPVVASATIYPQFIKFFNENNINGLKQLYKNIFFAYTVFAILSYVFMYSFSDVLIPLAFGKGYPGAVTCSQQMFLTFLLMPTVLLQANLIVAIKLEKLDMWLNIFSLIINVAGCLIGLSLVKDLAVVNYSVFISFLVFHILQDIILIRRKLMTLTHCLFFYSALVVTILACQHFMAVVSSVIFFICFSAILLLSSALIFMNQRRKLSTAGSFNTAVTDK